MAGIADQRGMLEAQEDVLVVVRERGPREAPDVLDDESAGHFDAVQAGLRAAEGSYRINPRLVRGLDYYNRTVIEWTTTRLGAQGTVCGGGPFGSAGRDASKVEVPIFS